ncbi:MAG: hypothetical protein ACC619_06780 [Paracoccaceae bacterium]
MTLTFPQFGFSKLTRLLRQSPGPQELPRANQLFENDVSRTERTFLLEVMCANPEAVQSDLGLMAMMSQYPTRF